MDSLLQNGKEIFTWAKAALANSSELEIYLNQGRGRSVVWSEKKCEDIHQAEGGGVGIRVILQGPQNGGRQGFAFTTQLDRASVQKTAERAYASAPMLPADEFRQLPQKPGRANALKLDSDPELFKDSVPVIQEKLKRGEENILKKYPLLRSILRAGFSEGEGSVAIVNSNGIEAEYAESYSGLGVSALAEQAGERQEGGFSQTMRFKKDLDWDMVFEKSAQRTLSLLGGRTIPTGTVPVVFDPTVACEFLSLVAGAVCADSVQKGKSFYAHKRDQTVASSLITIYDDGTYENGLASAPFDDEGIPTQKTVVIKAGQLKGYLYDTYSALKDKTQSTGNASRAGFKSSPSSGTSNFYIAAGADTRSKLLAETTGLYLYDVMGLHMADPISGEFSVGVMGAWLEGGEFKFGVRGVTLAGTILQLFSNVDRVSDDLTFFGSTGSPTIRVQGMMVSGQ